MSAIGRLFSDEYQSRKLYLFTSEGCYSYPQYDNKYTEHQVRKRQADLSCNLDELVRTAFIKHTYEDNLAIRSAIHSAIMASSLNALEPAVAIQNRFDGILKRQKTGLQEFTSLSLFLDSVECLLRQLYGDIESYALHNILISVFMIVKALTRLSAKDLWQEHQDAKDWDHIWSAWYIEHNHRVRAYEAVHNLATRFQQVRDSPSAFSSGTVEFATIHLPNHIDREFLGRDRALLTAVIPAHN